MKSGMAAKSTIYQFPGQKGQPYELNTTLSPSKPNTTLQYVMNTKLSPHRFWPCHENGPISSVQTIPHILYLSFKLTSLYCGLQCTVVWHVSISFSKFIPPKRCSGPLKSIFKLFSGDCEGLSQISTILKPFLCF